MICVFSGRFINQSYCKCNLARRESPTVESKANIYFNKIIFIVKQIECDTLNRSVTEIVAQSQKRSTQTV